MTRVNYGLLCVLALALALGSPLQSSAQRKRTRATASTNATLERSVRAHLGFLASDAMKGRKSGSDFERIAAEYIGAQFQSFGLEPGADGGAYVQRVPLEQQRYTAAPKLRLEAPGNLKEWTYGADFSIEFQTAASATGTLAEPAARSQAKPGAWVVAPAGQDGRQSSLAAYGAGAAGVILRERVEQRGPATGDDGGVPKLPARLPGSTRGGQRTFVVLSVSADVAAAIDAAPAGTTLSFGGELAISPEAATWNAMGVLRGTDPVLSKEVVMLSAHLDHLGEVGEGPDRIYNGADDDASGCVAVIELARILASGPKPKRTVYFVCFGSEEAGGFGAQYFISHPPVPIEHIAVDLNFEMIGRPDAAVAAGTLWLTGYERSNLGPLLVQRGARLVADPHPDEHFFERSDNYTLALRGVVAQTVSSFGLHTDYHHVSDDVSKVDFGHMTRSISSMIAPVRWLVTTRTRPAWDPGEAPKRE